MPTASLRPRSGLAAARACRKTKEDLREMARGFVWGSVVLVCLGVLFLYLAAR